MLHSYCMHTMVLTATLYNAAWIAALFQYGANHLDFGGSVYVNHDHGSRCKNFLFVSLPGCKNIFYLITGISFSIIFGCLNCLYTTHYLEKIYMKLELDVSINTEWQKTNQSQACPNLEKSKNKRVETRFKKKTNLDERKNLP